MGEVRPRPAASLRPVVPACCPAVRPGECRLPGGDGPGRPGDVYGASTGERSELALLDSAEGPGQQWYYAWSTLFPAGWQAPRGWGAIVQWHSRFPVPAAIALDARGSTLKLELFAGSIGTGGLVTRT